MLFSRKFFLVLFLFVSIFSLNQKTASAHCGTCAVNLAHGSEEHSGGAMINSPTASTLGKGTMAAGFSFIHQDFNEIPASDAHSLHHDDRDIHGKLTEQSYNMLLGYGVTNDLDIELVVPVNSHSFNQVHDHDALGRDERSSGFGDMKLMGKYRFWKEGFDAAVIAGVKFPTGKTTNQDKSEAKIEAEQQPGSSSWDGEFGLAASRNINRRVSLSTAFRYILKTKGAQGLNQGDLFQYDIGISFALKELGQTPNVQLVTELNTIWALQDRNRAGEQVFDSGGTSMFLTPGIIGQINQNLSCFAALPIPIYQNLGGEHEEVQIAAIAGISVRFS